MSKMMEISEREASDKKREEDLEEEEMVRRVLEESLRLEQV